MARRRKKKTFSSWVDSRGPGTTCQGLAYDPDTKTFTAVITVTKTVTVPATVEVVAEDEDRYSGSAIRKHLIFPFKDEDDEIPDTQPAPAAEAGVGGPAS